MRRSHRPRHPLLGAALLTATLFSLATTPLLATPRLLPPDTEGGRDVPASPQPPLRTKAELDAWLKANDGKPTPLDAFTAGARERFLGGLAFGENGLGTLAPEELGWELDNEQSRAVLALFGEASYASRVSNHPLPPRWRGSRDQPSDIDQRYSNYIIQSDSMRASSELEKASSLGKLYRAQFPRTFFNHPEKLRDPDLQLLARASANAAMATNVDDIIQDILLLIPLVEQRGLDITPLASDAQVAMLGAGQLERARSFAAEHPSLDFEPLPLVKVSPDALPTGPRWWRLSPDAVSMQAESADLSELQLLVLAGCHFSAEAAEDVQADPELAQIFARHAHWLGLPLGDEDIAAWKDWNRLFPKAPMHLITRRADWPMFPEWRMPTYVIVQDGKIIEQTRGSWRNAPEHRAALVDMLRRHGLMPPAGDKTASIPQAATTAIAD